MNSIPDLATRGLLLGWPRGGLGYVSCLLQQDNCEVGFSLDASTTQSNSVDRWRQGKAFELSSAAVPFCCEFAAQAVPAVFIARDPMRVLNSLLYHGLFQANVLTPWFRKAAQHLPGFAQHALKNPILAASWFILSWFDIFRQHYPQGEIVRVEESGYQVMRKVRGPFRRKFYACTPDTNASNCRQVLTLDDLPQDSRPQMKNLLAHLNYETSPFSPRGCHAHYHTPEFNV